MHGAGACLAGGGGFTSLCQTQLNMTYGWIKEMGNKLGLLIESLSIKRTAPSSSCSRSLKVLVCWICCCLFMVSHIDVRPACCRAARFACSDLLACVLDWLTVSQHVHLFPRCSAPCRIPNLFRNTPLHRPLHMECCPVSFVPPKKYCAADVGSALPMAARTPAGLDEVPAADAEHRFAYAAGLPRWRTWHRLL